MIGCNRATPNVRERRMKTILHLLIAATVTGVASCGRVPIRPDAIASINSVSVSPTVGISRTVAYDGPEEALAQVLGGTLGSGIASAAVNAPAVGGVLGVLIGQGFVTPREQIKAYLAKENLDVAQIARNEFIKGLQADPRFETKLAEQGNAHFELEVYRYGLSQRRNPFSPEYKAWLGIRVKLIDSSGVVLWQDRASVSRGRDDAVPAAPYAAYFEDPATFRNGFTTAARFLTQRMLREMESTVFRCESIPFGTNC
jgi:hypothetical protein